ncbi:uncharacterized protein [Amphiura filiformis]|uniref:uncharacterized protein n=1 Tax=Amphiura filiformis TaxID=82378 RepID=UPI003B225334
MPAKQPRFADTSEADLVKLESARHEKKTMDTTAWAVRLIKEWCKATNHDEKFETLPPDTLCQLLRQFYGSARKENGQPYSKSSLLNIRAALQRYISSPPFNRTINIIRSEQFQSANNVFSGALKVMKRDGKDTSKHYPPITTEDLSKMFDTKVLSMNNPQSLQRLVFSNASTFFFFFAGGGGRLTRFKEIPLQLSRMPQGRSTLQ